MTVREAKGIIEDMRQAALADALTGIGAERYNALGVAIEAIEHWINGGAFPSSTQYIKCREKSIAGAEMLAKNKGKGEAVLKTYIYDAGFADGYMRNTPNTRKSAD